MGYTHYWKGLKANGLEENAKKIVKVAMEDGIKLGDGCGVNEPIIKEGFIDLNGWEDYGEDHETFRLSDNTSFDFCKTARKPYDTVVVAILIDAIVNNLKYDDISSDGNYSDWQDGIELYKKAVRDLNEDDISRIKNVLHEYI